MRHRLGMLSLCLALQGVFILSPVNSFTKIAQAAPSRPLKSTVKFEAVKGEGVNKIEARQDAFRNAIAQAVGVFVRSDTTVKDYVTKSDRVRTNSQGFIQSFKLLEENITSDGIIEVVYAIEVSTAPLETDLKQVVGTEFSNVGHPTVAVIGYNKEQNTAVAALNRALINRGYKVVDASQIRRLRTENALLKRLADGATPANFSEVARQIAQRLKADIYVTAFGAIEDKKVSIATRMYSSYTGQIFGSETAYSTSPDQSTPSVRRAIDQAITSSMTTVLNQVSNHWQDVLQNGQEYVVVLDGYRSGKQRRRFKQLLSEVDNVIQVKQINASGGRAEFSLRGNGPAGDIFDEIIDLAEAAGMKFVNDEPVVRGGRAVFLLK